jgi:nitrate reductase NapAB chaperone NapD
MLGSQSEMHIAGIVVRCKAPYLASIIETLGKSPSVEVHQVTERKGLIIATVETQALDQQIAVTTEMLYIEGVVDVDLVYHAFEPVIAPTEEVCAL